MSNPLCLLYRRRLSKAAASEAVDVSGRLAAHVDRCGECSRAWRELCELRMSLAAMPSVAQPSAEFAVRVWERLDSLGAERRSAGFRSSTAPAAAAAAVLLLWVLCRAPIDVSPASSTALGGALERPTDVGPRLAGNPSRGHRVALSSEGLRPLLERRRSARPRYRRHRSHPRTIVAQNSTVPAENGGTNRTPAKAAERRGDDCVTWTRVGAWHEAVGEYHSAEAAYGAAYSCRPDPAIAFHAGRAAESAGDFAVAIDYYARALTPAAPATGAQKGSMKWSNDGASA